MKKKFISGISTIAILIGQSCPGYAEVLEDAAHVSGAKGPAVLTRRIDTAATSAGTDGDYSTLNTDGSGRVWVNVGATSITPAAGSITKNEDDAHASLDDGVEVLTVRTDAAASSAGTDGDYATLNSDSTGRLWTTGTVLEDVAETAGGQGSASLSVRRDTPASSAGTTGDYATLNTDANGLLYAAAKITAQDIEANGNSLYTNIALAGTKAEVSDSPALVKSITFTQVNDEADYLFIYDLDADDVTVGTTAATYTFYLPIGTATFNPVHTIDFGEPGIALNTGFTIAAGETSDGMTAPDTAFGVAIEYK